MNAIQMQHLTKSYGKARGIVDLNLQVERGAFYGFIGPNGAGKSTTIRTLLGLIAPSGGSAQVLGIDIRSPKEILAKIGYLPAESAYYPGLRVRDVLTLSARLHHKDCRAAADTLCRRMDLDPSRKIDELSLGNRKKVGIVCALQHDPELLILDEATSGLDPLMQREFFDILRQRNRQGTTIFLSSHVLSEIQRNCTEAAIIRNGRIIRTGSVSDLTRTNARRVSFRGTAALDGLSIRDLQMQGSSTSFLYGGALPPLLQALARGQVEDLTIAEPDLEEIFLHYYEKEAQP